MQLTDPQTEGSRARRSKPSTDCLRRVLLLTPDRDGTLAPRNIVAFTFTHKAAAELKDYDGDSFVDCQMFFDFKTPNIKAALKAEVDPEEFTLKLASEPFPVRGYKRIAVKVVDVYGNESTLVRELAT